MQQSCIKIQNGLHRDHKRSQDQPQDPHNDAMLIRIVPSFLHPLYKYVAWKVIHNLAPLGCSYAVCSNKDNLRQQRLYCWDVADDGHVREETTHVSATQPLMQRCSPRIPATMHHHISFPVCEHNRHRSLIQIQQERLLADLSAFAQQILCPLPTDRGLA